MKISPIQQDDALEKVVLVDNHNRVTGLMDKLVAHQVGALHRAFSVFIFNHQNELLLQKRAGDKYHSPNQWANSCCGHPRENESTQAAAQRRLMEEMGLDEFLKPGIEFIYQAKLDDNLIEHEYVQFFTGVTAATPTPNPFEVADYLWMSHEQLLENPQSLDFAPWFQIYRRDYAKALDAMFIANLQIPVL